MNPNKILGLILTVLIMLTISNYVGFIFIDQTLKEILKAMKR